MDVFVTGGTGGIGSAVVKQLVSNGCNVIGLSRSDSSSERLQRLGSAAYPGDLAKPETWTERAAACDAVIHMGATFAADMARVDRHAMLELKKTARHRKQPLKVIYTGGVWLFPQSSGGKAINEKAPFEPLPAFRFMTETIKSLSTGTDIALSIVHPALVCGPDFGPIADMTASLKDTGRFETRASGSTYWPLVDVDDLARLYACVLKRSQFRMSVIGCGVSGVLVDHLASHISARHGKPLEIVTEQRSDGLEPDLDWAAGYALSQVTDNTFATQTLNWAPENQAVEDLVLKHSR